MKLVTASENHNEQPYNSIFNSSALINDRLKELRAVFSKKIFKKLNKLNSNSNNILLILPDTVTFTETKAKQRFKLLLI